MGRYNMKADNFGDILAQLRKAKGMTQSEAATDIVTRAYLSQLESDKNKISLEVFLKLLDKYNTSLYEFEYLLQEQERMSIKTNHLTDIQNIVYEYSDQELELYVKHFKEAPRDIYSHAYHMKLLGEAILHYRKEGTVEKAVYKDLLTYLFKVEMWGLYELKLLVNLVIFTDYRQNQTFYRHIEKKLSHTRFIEKDKLLAQLYLNLSYAALNYNDYQNVYRFVEKGLIYTQKYHYVFEQILLHINFYIAKSIQNVDLDPTIYQYLNMLKYLGYPKIIQRVKQQLSKYNLVYKNL